MLISNKLLRSTLRVARWYPVRTRFSRLPSHARLCGQQALRASSGVEGYIMKPITTDAELNAERIWLTTAMTTWLDEEWTALPEHRKLGQAAADAYVALRRRGEDDMASVLLAVVSELLRPDLAAAFHSAFTDPFEVSNKLVEMVMLRDGCDVCCTSLADRDRIHRIDQLISSDIGSSSSMEA